MRKPIFELVTSRLRARSAIVAVLVAVILAWLSVPLFVEISFRSFEPVLWAFVLVVLVLGLWAIRSIDRRLTSLTEIAQAIEQGRYSLRPPDVGSDSVADLSRALHRMADRVHERVYHDSLSGLPNRRFFDELLEPAVELARAEGHLLGVFMVDLDRFKHINDSYGHDRGDELLRRAAVRLLTTVRESDTVARLGGDEFGVVIGHAESVDALLGSARRVLAAFREPFELGRHELVVTCSIGLSVFPGDASGLAELLRHADSALYRAKSSGGNKVHVFDEAMSEWANLRAELGRDLQRALQRGEIELHFQPQISLADGRIVGIEALARWQHPERGLLQPDTFIPIAEETGLIPALGACVLEKAARINAEWQRDGLARLPIAANVSPRQLQAGTLPPFVEKALQESGLEPEFLRLEISDNHAFWHMESVLGNLNELGKLGIRFAIDDFGIGYSSLRHLLRYPLYALKIDRTLVQGVPDDADSITVVSAAIGLAHGLGLEVLAEGVETERQLDYLREKGCDMAQGFLACRPLPAAEFAEVLAQGRIDVAAG